MSIDRENCKNVNEHLEMQVTAAKLFPDPPCLMAVLHNSTPSKDPDDSEKQMKKMKTHDKTPLKENSTPIKRSLKVDTAVSEDLEFSDWDESPIKQHSGVTGFPPLNDFSASIELVVLEVSHKDGLVDIICKRDDGRESVVHLQDWLVSNKCGIVIVSPNTLVPCTSITGATWCARKVVLNERFRGPTVANKSMLIGVVVHELFQVIADWIQTNLPGGKSYCSLSSPLKLLKVHDIEENIWSPQLGMKGKVDVTIEIKSDSQSRLRSLELKTGKSGQSAEHAAQVMLYSLMLSSHYKQPIVDGFLLYLKDGVTRAVQPRALELKAIINQRNHLANYLADLNPKSLPPPRTDPRFCDKCDHKLVCSFYQWIYYEWAEDQTKKGNQISDLWTKPVELRQSEGLCASNLVLISQVKSSTNDTSVLLTFRSASEISETVFSPGSMCLISTSTKFGFLLVPIIDCSFNTITVRSDRMVKLDDIYHLDIYNSSSTYPTTLGNLVLLMGNDEGSSRLRKLIIDLAPPMPISSPHNLSRSVHQILSNSVSAGELNEEQKRAVEAALMCKNYTLIEGFPGTGKTTTIVQLLRCLIEMEQSILLTANTHSALDNVLIKLRKVLEPVTFSALNTSNRFVLVGDAHQLSPLVQNKKCAKEGMSVSLFERLQVHKNVLHSLTLQYRMNRTIAKLSSDLFYESRLLCGTRKVAEACLLDFQGFKASSSEGAWKVIESGHLDDAVVFVDTSALDGLKLPVWNNGVGSMENIVEARLVCDIVSRFLAIGVSSSDIGIMSVYRKQVDLIKSLIDSTKEIEVNSVDQFQGRDKSVIVWSLVWISSCGKRCELLHDKRRINVALTRAKHKLVLVGCAESMKSIDIMKQVVNNIIVVKP
ncbi:DNA replication factor Dna2 [Dictyocaulus viviparus]|uniref:DNA replication ATP-dependent helicase/nuclease n=1 Tax=Dictyocaulus viviparus TaxID=29172 RepID=A0A0D8XN36_DICVI|nr:DNA replication factor Dna2 [Dictyocaulus viviparus]